MTPPIYIEDGDEIAMDDVFFAERDEIERTTTISIGDSRTELQLDGTVTFSDDAIETAAKKDPTGKGVGQVHLNPRSTWSSYNYDNFYTVSVLLTVAEKRKIFIEIEGEPPKMRKGAKKKRGDVQRPYYYFRIVFEVQEWQAWIKEKTGSG